MNLSPDNKKLSPDNNFVLSGDIFLWSRVCFSVVVLYAGIFGNDSALRLIAFPFGRRFSIQKPKKTKKNQKTKGALQIKKPIFPCPYWFLLVFERREAYAFQFRWFHRTSAATAFFSAQSRLSVFSGSCNDFFPWCNIFFAKYRSKIRVTCRKYTYYYFSLSLQPKIMPFEDRTDLKPIAKPFYVKSA